MTTTAPPLPLDLLADEAVATTALVSGDDLLVPATAVEAATGWHLNDRGLCHGEACIPVRDRAALVPGAGGLLSLRELARLLRRPLALEAGTPGGDTPAGAGTPGGPGAPGAAVAVLGHSAADAGEALASGLAPDLELADLHGRRHRLSDLRGRKVMLVAWASWCGCRYDLPEWEKAYRELRDHGFELVSVAVDRPEDARPFVEAADATHTALVDPDHVVADRYNIVNVPTVVWVDEEGRVVRPNDTQTATDLFRSMNGIDSAACLAALRRWVLDGDAGLGADDVAAHRTLPTADDQRARAEYRVGAWLAERGRGEAAERHFAEAGRLAPHDLTIRRGSMPLRGVDPMGDEYFALRQELEDAGVALYRPLPR